MHDMHLRSIVLEGERTIAQLQQSGLTTISQIQQQLEREFPFLLLVSYFPTLFNERMILERLRDHCTSIWGRLSGFESTFDSSLMDKHKKEQRDEQIASLIQSLLVRAHHYCL